MKKKLNISLEDELMLKVKFYATKNHISVTKIVEDYLTNITQGITKRQLAKMPKEWTPNPADNLEEIKESYFQYQAKKYGFKI